MTLGGKDNANPCISCLAMRYIGCGNILRFHVQILLSLSQLGHRAFCCIARIFWLFRRMQPMNVVEFTSIDNDISSKMCFVYCKLGFLFFTHVAPFLSKKHKQTNTTLCFNCNSISSNSYQRHSQKVAGSVLE